MKRRTVDKDNMGAEYEWKGLPSNTMIARAYSWYNYYYSIDSGKPFLVDYVTKHYDVEHVKIIKQVPNTIIPNTVLWKARILNRGLELPKECIEKFECDLVKLFEYNATSRVVPTVTKSVRDYTREKINDLIAELEEEIDLENWTLNIYEWLQSKQVKPNISKAIHDFYFPKLEEMKVYNKFPDLKEAYKSVPNKRNHKRLLENIVSDTLLYSTNLSKQKAPRKKRTKKVATAIKDLKYNKESKVYKISSINPEKAIGSKLLYVFDVSTRYLHVYISSDGLQIKGTSFLNYNNDLSFKVKLRKPEDVLHKLSSERKNVCKKIIENLKAKKTLVNKRCTKNMVILRAF